MSSAERGIEGDQTRLPIVDTDRIYSVIARLRQWFHLDWHNALYLVWLRSAFGVRVLRLISGSLRLGFFRYRFVAMESSQGCGGKRFLSFLRWGGFLGCGDRGSWCSSLFLWSWVWVKSLGLGEWGDCQDILTRFGLKLVKLGIFPKLRIFVGELRGWKLGRIGIWGILWTFSLSW